MEFFKLLSLLFLLIWIKADVIKLGAILPLSGDASDIGRMAYEGISLKVEELKKIGRNYELVVEDTRSNVTDGVNAFRRMVDFQNIKIIFTTLSRHGMSLKELAEKNRVLLFANNAHPYQTKDTSLVLRHMIIVDDDIKTLANEIVKAKYHKACIINHKDEWGDFAGKGLQKKLSDLGVANFREAVDLNQTDFRTVAIKLLKEQCDALVTFLFGPAQGLIIKQSRELGFKGEIYSSINMSITPSAQKAAGNYLKGTYYLDMPNSIEFANLYRERFYKDPPPACEFYYRSVEIVDYAIQMTKSQDPETLVQYIKSLKIFNSSTGPVQILPSGDIPGRTVLAKF
ncbi:MAG: ABC transporter substrate-binding protein [Deltaproteobacteria bacterium]|nr:ABC transporter substrate-binding protein [Deltaproteobacteria bacterium]